VGGNEELGSEFGEVVDSPYEFAYVPTTFSSDEN
jgi:hypothetical protein